MNAQRDESLLRGVVQVAADPASLGCCGREGARLQRAQLALEPAGLDSQQRRGRGGVDELGVLCQCFVRVESGNGQPVAPALRPLPARVLGWTCERDARRVAEVTGAGIPERKPERRIVEGPCDDVAPAFRRGPVRKLAQELAEGAAGEEVGLQERDRESEREHDPHAGEDPGERLESAAVDSDHEHREVEDEQRRNEQQRRRCDRYEAPSLRPGGGSEASDPDGGDAGDDSQPDVGDDRRHRLEELRLRADVERVAGARLDARGQRSFAGERGGEEERRAEVQRQDEDQGREQLPVGGGSEPAGGEGEAEVQAHRDRRGGAQDAEGVYERLVGALPRDRPGQVPECDEEWAEPARGATAPPHESDENRGHDQIGRVAGGSERIREVVARHPEQERRGGDRGRAPARPGAGRSTAARRGPRAHPRPRRLRPHRKGRKPPGS